MKTVEVGKECVTISFTKDEIGFIGNAINETFEALDDWEFPIRTGTSIAEAQAIQQEIVRLCRAIDKK